ncbi:MAG: hypothetical protein PQ963_02140 [Methanobacterium sp.]|jgi:hypothetical protein
MFSGIKNKVFESIEILEKAPNLTNPDEDIIGFNDESRFFVNL